MKRSEIELAADEHSAPYLRVRSEQRHPEHMRMKFGNPLGALRGLLRCHIR
ncbi:MAG: hypothetical protein AAF654_10035 [Myxococcota bacterium]